jgi:phosphoglycolate phosphatase-like HAD superfamily hydrolase
MVGDTLSDMNFAINGGIRSVGLAKSEENKAILLEKTDTVVPDISYLNTVI